MILNWNFQKVGVGWGVGKNTFSHCMFEIILFSFRFKSSLKPVSLEWQQKSVGDSGFPLINPSRESLQRNNSTFS